MTYKPEDKLSWALVSAGTEQTMYLGQVDKAVEVGKPTTLFNCRMLRTMLLPTANAGIAQQTMVVTIPPMRGPVTVHVLPTAVIYPMEYQSSWKKLKEQIQRCEKTEQQIAASDAGLVLPHGPVQ